MKKLSALTYVEVLVSLVIVSLVFTTLTSMAISALVRAKKLELQDRMRAYATEGLQVAQAQKDSGWDVFVSLLPPASSSTSPTIAFVVNDPSPVLIQNASMQCVYDENLKIIIGCSGSNEEKRIVSPDSGNTKLFGRIILRTDTSAGNQAEIKVIVACLENSCSGTEYEPFILTTTLYRLGIAQ